jgi:PST family polysaccharide transporter
MKEYKKDTIFGLKWSFISNSCQHIAIFLTTIILVKLLSPSDFGLMGMATVVIGFIDIFKNFGIASAIIQRNDISDSFISTLFWVNFGFGTFMAVILYFGAPLAELFYKEPRVTPIIKLLSINFFISGSFITHKALLEKKLAFKLLAKIEIFSILFGAIVGIIAALFGHGVFSLVYQAMTRVISSTIFFWVSVGYRPKLTFLFREINKIFSFSIYLTSFNVVNYIMRNADYLIIGKFLGAQSLGYYTLGYKLMLLPVQNLSNVIGRVLFPVYSKYKEDNKKIRELVLTTSSTISFITIPVMFGLMAIAYPLIISIFGNKWAPAIPIIIILAPVGFLQSISVPLNTIFLAKGRTDVMFYWVLFAGSITIIFFIVGLRWGIIGVASGYAISGVLLLYPSLIIRLRLITLSVLKFISVLYKPFLIGIFMAISVAIINYLLLDGISHSAQLCILIPFGGVFYIYVCFLFNKSQIYDFVRFLKEALEGSL